MTVFQAVVLGILQGLAEFLPISSSAHLSLAPWVFGWKDPGLAFDVALHVGTLVAVLWYFRQQWIALVLAAFRIVAQGGARTPEERRVGHLIIATIPGAIGGLALEKYAEETLRAPWLTAVALAIMGTILWVVDHRARQDRALSDMRWIDALLIGLAQVAALVPGVSRSGATMTAGRGLRLNREDAATFSFLMSMPIIAAAAILKVPEVLRTADSWTPLVAGISASALSGWAAIAFLIRFVSRNTFGVFAVYRWVLAVAILALVYLRH